MGSLGENTTVCKIEKRLYSYVISSNEFEKQIEKKMRLFFTLLFVQCPTDPFTTLQL